MPPPPAPRPSAAQPVGASPAAAAGPAEAADPAGPADPAQPPDEQSGEPLAEEPEAIAPERPARSHKPLWAMAAAGGAALIAAPLLLAGGGSADTPAPAALSRSVGLRTPVPQTSVQPLAPREFATASPAPSNSVGSQRPATPKTARQPASPNPAAPGHTSASRPLTTSGGRQKSPGPAKSAAEQMSSAPPATAAAAVSRLVAALKQSGVSSGRHVCYRAYVTDIGWQSPVCDGDVAGAAGQNRAIEELEIASSGTGGVSGSAYVQSLEWLGWTGAGNSANLYVGTTARALRLEALAMRVGSGSICLDADVQNTGYQGYRCNKVGDYTSAGTMGQSLRIEAIRITV